MKISYSRRMTSSWLRFFCLALLAAMLAPPSPVEGAWRVIPIRLDFDQRTRSGVITVANDGEEKISFVIEAAEWMQDETGKDQYSPTTELVFFPKQLTIGPKQERIIRAGIQAPAISREKSYRLFIKEVATPKESEGSAVAITIQFGVPIFANPLKDEFQGEIRHPALSAGQAQATIANTGNRHFRIQKVAFTARDATGESVFSQEVDGWYLLPGVARAYSTAIPAELCPQLKTIDIQVSADRVNLNGKIDVDPALCASQ